MDIANQELLENELRRDEGVWRIKYLDQYGNPTTGVGHNLRAAPLPEGWFFPLTDDQVTKLLQYDLICRFSELNRYCAWWTKLDDVRQRVVANMVFNMGIGRFLGFTHFIKDLRAGDYNSAAAEMVNSKWYGEVGARAVRLHQAMTTGTMPL